MGIGKFFGGSDSGTSAFYRRVLSTASAHGGYDLLKDPQYASVIDEIIAGRDIKAVQIYCDDFAAPMAEGHAAVKELRHLLDHG